MAVSALALTGCSKDKDPEAEVSMPTTDVTAVENVEVPADMIDAAPLENEAASEAAVTEQPASEPSAAQ